MALEGEQLNKLLRALDPDPERAAEKYIAINSQLISFFVRKGCGPNSEDLAEETLDRVAKKIGSSLFQLDRYFLNVPKWCFKLKDRKHGSSLFQVGVILDATSLCRRLREKKQQLSKYLGNQFELDNPYLLEQYTKKKPDQVLSEALVEFLNKVLEEPLLYEPERFEQVKLSEQTLHLIELNPVGKDLLRLNRTLLEEAYPHEIRNGALSDYLLSQFAPDTLQLLEQYTSSRTLSNKLATNELLNALGVGLRTLLSGPSIYDQVRFGQTELREGTKSLLAQNPQDADLLRLNYMLMEDAYPAEMVKSLSSYAEGVARKILLEVWREGRRGIKGSLPGTIEDDEDDKDRKSQCLERCKKKLHRLRPKLFSRKHLKLLWSFHEAEGPGKKQKREKLAEDSGIKPNHMRTLLSKMRLALRSCINECLAKFG